MNVEKGWLKEQLEYAKSQTESWPDWKKEDLYGSGLPSKAQSDQIDTYDSGNGNLNTVKELHT